ncbi:MAG: hypothetical protein PHV82_06980 [Victivallaceae bacterium]|nr:hypothetical protein [Victivallaceae bacterium]
MMGRVAAVFLCILILCGCSSIDGSLSESEKITIIDMARYTITRQNKKFVTDQEAAEINKTMPEVRIHYTGPRQGKMWISWSLDKKKINFVYSGEFLTDSAMWQMWIAKYKYATSKEKMDPFHKRPQATAADFADLRKKDKVVPRK